MYRCFWVEPVFRATGKKALQCVGGNVRIAELPGSARGRCETLHGITVMLRSLADGGKGGGFAGAGDSLQSLHSVMGSEYLFNGVPLRSIELGTSLGEWNSVLNGHELRSAALASPHLLYDLFFCLDSLRRGELASGVVLFSSDNTELAGGDTRFEAGADLRVGRLSHTPPHGIDKECAFIHYSFALKAAVAGKGHGGVRPLPALLYWPLLYLALAAFARFRHYFVSLIAELSGDLPMCSHHFCRRHDHFLVAGVMGGDLCGFGAAESAARQGLDDLLTARAGGIKVLLCVPL